MALQSQRHQCLARLSFSTSIAGPARIQSSHWCHSPQSPSPSLSRPSRRSISTTIPRWNDQPASPSRPNESIKKHLDSALDLTTNSSASTRHGRSHFASPRAQEERRAERGGQELGKLNLPRRRDSIEDLLADYSDYGRSLKGARKEGQPGQSMGGLSGRPERKGDRMLMNDLLDPEAVSDKLDPMRNTRIPRQSQLPFTLPVRLGPTVGRTVKVSQQKNIDVGKAFRQLEILCRKNAVKSDFARQRFHERGGLKRKRIKSERWRRTFKEGFKGMIALVKKMKKQGW